jgi:hypothetical protein
MGARSALSHRAGFFIGLLRDGNELAQFAGSILEHPQASKLLEQSETHKVK